MSDVQIYGPTFSTFVRSVMLICEERGLSYSTGFVLDGEKIEFQGEAHVALHPWAKLPVTRHQGADLYETQAIGYYLNGFGDGPSLLPESALARAQTLQWCAAISGYIDSALVRRYLLEFARPKGENGSVRMEQVTAAEPEVRRSLEILSAQLGNQAFLCGEQLTLADLLLLPMLDYLSSLPQGAALIEPGSPLSEYLQRLRARPSAQRVLTAA